MEWTRVYITVEGPTEKEFADLVLVPHLANYSIEVKPRVVITKRKLGQRGGILDFDKIRGDLVRLMRQDQAPHAHFTTMIDLYALPAQFPGWEDARQRTRPRDRVSTLENAFAEVMGEKRFLPYIQLHEFEALLYCDLTQLERRIAGSEQGLASLSDEVRHLAPEDIDEGSETAPSKRLIRYVPVYERSKVRVGAQAASAIGLPVLRAKCPHFADWVARLEKMGSQAGEA